ncbi:MAG TPA: hypothetical protein VLI06_00395 [Solimonas sp.]|nr:hypothetical protein [Solimonas sp.]
MKTLLHLCGCALLAFAGIATAAPATTADQILDRYIAACGGSENLSRIRNRVMEAKISSGILSLKVKTQLVWPNLWDEQGSLLGIAAGSGHDGSTAWTIKGSDITVVQGKEFRRLLRGHSLDWHKQIRQWYPTRRLLPDAVVDGSKVQVLEMIADTGDREVWRFDAATGLLRQLESIKQEDDPDEPPVMIISNLGDYRQVDGVTLAFRITGTEGRKKFSLDMLSLVNNGKVEAPRFPAKK